MSDRSAVDRVAYRLETWKKHLIDLSRRNRLLNYRATKRTTVEIVDEIPQQILRQLLEGQSFRFDPKSAAISDEESNSSTSENESEVDELWIFRAGEGELPRRTGRSGDDLSGVEATKEPERILEKGQELKTGTGALAQHHKDDRLQTTYTEDRLEKNLTAIYRKAQSSLEEQGVNTLFLALGMLEWYEAKSSDEVNKAPLLLVPVNLRRNTAADPFRLSLRDEEPMLNPALAERMKQDFGIELPRLSDLTSELNIEGVLEEIRDSVSGFPRWRLISDIALGTFDFRKFVLFRDIERHEDLFAQKPLIRALCSEGDEAIGTLGLPQEIQEAELDEEMSPWDTVQILDADSSQLRAMLAVRRGHNLVIEGPPGTGKSQTISNIIADQLAEGRSVLFVSEKMAALEVVKSRLDEAGLGAFCLELHSDKTAKTEFVRELRESLDFELEQEVDSAGELRRLKKVADSLNEYVTALHETVEPLGWSPFQAISKLTEVEDQPRVAAKVVGLQEATEEDYREARDHLSELAEAIDEIGPPSEHPLRGFGLTRAGRTKRASVRDAVGDAIKDVDHLISTAEECAEFFGFRSPRSVGDVELMLDGAQVVTNSPGAERSVLENPSWNEISADARELLELGRQYEEQHEIVERRFEPGVLDQDLSEEIDQFEREIRSGFWRFFKPSYWTVRSRLRSYLRDDYQPDDNKQLIWDYRVVGACKETREAIDDQDQLGKELFGGRWTGPESDWGDLEAFAEWVVDLRKYALEEVLSERGIETAAAAELDSNRAEDLTSTLRDARNRAHASLEELSSAGELDPEESDVGTENDRPLRQLRFRLAEIDANLDRLRTYSSYRSARVRCSDGMAAEYVPTAIEMGLETGHFEPAFRRLFLETWLERVFEDRPVLGDFRSKKHEEKLQRFRRLDRRSREIARRRTQEALKGRRKGRLMVPELQSELQRVQREARKQRKIMPIRKLLARSPNVVQQIKPCFMMSPLSVGKYLDPEVYEFDLLVFDEASQIPPADAIGAILRADQVVVVGDQKQLPPTQFFGIELDDAGDIDEEELDLLTDMESILDEIAVAGIPSVRLKWHYRSQHESLIRFSNEEFYSDDPLYTFPHAAHDRDDLGLQFEYLEDAVYEGGGQNPEEARRVADAVVDHAREHPDLSLGVGTFGMSQQRRIQDELDLRRKRHPDIEPFFHQSGEDKFFVKNLENIQGDDRDVIFLSVTYGPDEAGNVRRNFGPINRSGGWRRLNVITTRAKRRLRVFSSMRAEDIDPRGIKRSARLLRKYLEYAETGEYPATNLGMGPPESPFERAVKAAVEALGYEVVAQVGESGYRIDLGVLDPERAGHYLCGIECDGASYHSAQTVRDRDRTRQEVLESRGWDIHRVWSTDWFHDRKSQIDRLEHLIQESRQKKERERIRSEREAAADRGTGATTGAPDSQRLQQASRGSSERSRSPLSDEEPPGLTHDHGPPIEAIPVETYRLADPETRGDSDQFYEASRKQIAKVVLEVVEVEGPIPEKLLVRRVGGAWGLQRVGKRIRSRVKEAATHLVSKGQLREVDGFYSLNSMQTPSVRRRDEVEINFKARQIPPNELVEAIRVLLQHRAPLLPDQIVSETASLLGFGRAGKRLRSQIEAAFESLREDGELEAGGYGLRLVDSRKRQGLAGRGEREDQADDGRSGSKSTQLKPETSKEPKTRESNDESRTHRRTSPEVPPEDSPPATLIEWVKSLDPSVWFGLSAWLKINDELRGKERSLAYNIGQIVANDRDPTEGQAGYARDVYEHAIQAGFDPKADV